MSSTDGTTRTRRERFDFENRDGHRLAALLELPPTPPRAHALFAHCFTCSKNVAAASRVSRALAARGIATLRFDFTGLGNSEGDFANSNFSSNVQDLIAAADHLRETREAPALLVGHSLGGAAVLAAAGEIQEVRAVATIAAPSDPVHVASVFEGVREQIEREGEAEVTLGGRSFRVRKQFLDDVERQRLSGRIHRLGRDGRALLILHSPTDDVVGVDQAAEIFRAALHPKSFISLDDADHLLRRPADAEYVAETIAAWSGRYLDLRGRDEQRPDVAAGEVLVRERDHVFTQDVLTDRHDLVADEPEDAGGADLGPSPYEYLLAGLGSCTAMTLRMYARHKDLPLDHVEVRLEHDRIHAEDCETCETETGKISRIRRSIRIEGDLTEEQRSRMLEIADRCPVHRTLEGEIVVETSPDGPSSAD